MQNNIIKEARKARRSKYEASAFSNREWIQRFVKKVSKKYPDFFDLFLDDLDVTPREKLITKYRYQEDKPWKEIPYMKGVNLELRQVMQLHRNTIDKIFRL